LACQSDLRVAGPFVVSLVADDGGADREVAVEHVALVQVADVDVPALGDPAGIRRGPQCKKAHQRGLAVAVPAHHADPVALLESEGYAIENGAGCVRDHEVLAAEQVCHVELLSSANGGSESRKGIKGGYRR
jgi:hypothetical protein